MKLDTRVGPSLFELKPNRDLVDAAFNGYKLSLDTLPIQTIELGAEIEKTIPNEDQYSIQHAKLFATHNCLFPDPWSPTNANGIYYVDVNWDVYKVSINPNTGRLINPIKVWTIPHIPAKAFPGRYNANLVFPSKNHAVLTDGCGRYFLLETRHHDATNQEECEEGKERECFWTEVYNDISTVESPSQSKFSYVLDGTYYSDSSFDFIDILLLRIDEKSHWKNVLNDHEDKLVGFSETSFVGVLEWKTLVKDRANNDWSIKSNRVLVGRTSVNYAYLEPGGTAVYIASDNPYYMVEDSENSIVPSVKSVEEAVTSNDNEDVAEKKPDYLWSQTSEDISIYFNLPGSCSKHEISVDTRPKSVLIQYKNQTMLDGSLSNSVKSEDSTWTLENGKLEITLPKTEEGLEWKDLVPGNTNGEQILDQEMIDQIHSRLAHLCSDKWENDPLLTDTFNNQQLEDCDVFPADSASLMRIDKALQRVTHQTSLGSHQWLFNTRTNSSVDNVPAIIVRHDVDGIVWQPQVTAVVEGGDAKANTSWGCKHIGTFSALGYVQASKVQRKFTVCSPDLSYVAICDTTKHIYIYRQPVPLENQLRNRKTGQTISHVANQQVASIEPPVEILGAYASSDVLFVLTSHNLHALRIRVSED